jgi:RNA 2',3'-cyclic 3'-phosphodiesterase
VAVPATEAVVEAAEEVIRGLRGVGDVRWVTPDRLHLTLKFLGETPADRVPLLQEVLAKKANNFSQFLIELGGVGAFPNGRKPQTLWLGLEGEGVEKLVRLAAKVDAAAGKLGFAREPRPYHPHLTIGRVKSPRGLPELSRELQERAKETVQPVEWSIEAFHLVRSTLRPDGPEYTILHHFPLR